MIMKNILKPLLIIIFLFSIIYTKAQLPPLSLSPLVPNTYTFDETKSSGILDINEDGVYDFIVYYYAYSGMPEYAYIRGFNSGNNVLSELVSWGMVEQPIVNAPPLGDFMLAGIPYTSLLTRGELIESSPLQPGLLWNNESYFFSDGSFDSPLLGTPLKANFTTGTYSGYVGVEFFIGSSLHYGWLDVEIDPDMEWVTINGVGFNAVAGSGILAGGSAVPIPLIASVLGFLLIGGGIFLRKKMKK
jgi:hypothetical protein